MHKIVDGKQVPLTAEEIAAFEAAAAEWEAARPAREAADVREKRNSLIAETDWWASSDLVMSDEQKAYRQALRDITAHANFPFLNEEDWPVKP